MGENISIFSAVMNRTDIIQEGLENWIESPLVDKVYVVDWSSTPPLPRFKHKKVFLIRVDGQKEWNLAKAFNLAARFSKGNILVKMDADYRMTHDLLKLKIQKNSFLRGNAGNAKEYNEKFINGFIMIYREDFFKVNGFNERLSGWGFDDTDLHIRLRDAGVKPINIPYGDIMHKPHESVLRHENTKYPYGRWRTNKEIAEKHPWGSGDQMMPYLVKNYWRNFFKCNYIQVEEKT